MGVIQQGLHNKGFCKIRNILAETYAKNRQDTGGHIIDIGRGRLRLGVNFMDHGRLGRLNNVGHSGATIRIFVPVGAFRFPMASLIAQTAGRLGNASQKLVSLPFSLAAPFSFSKATVVFSSGLDRPKATAAMFLQAIWNELPDTSPSHHACQEHLEESPRVPAQKSWQAKRLDLRQLAWPPWTRHQARAPHPLSKLKMPVLWNAPPTDDQNPLQFVQTGLHHTPLSWHFDDFPAVPKRTYYQANGRTWPPAHTLTHQGAQEESFSCHQEQGAIGFLDLGTLFLDLYMFFGPNHNFFWT